jgi:hypothetical protein
MATFLDADTSFIQMPLMKDLIPSTLPNSYHSSNRKRLNSKQGARNSERPVYAFIQTHLANSTLSVAISPSNIRRM